MVWTPLPESTGQRLVTFFQGPVGLTLWRLFLLALLVALVYALAVPGGIFAAFIAGTLLSVLFGDDIAAAVRDLWDMNFWEA